LVLTDGLLITVLLETFMKVLCIDRSIDTLELQSLSLAMRWPDAEVLKANDGIAGLSLFDLEDPDLVILDLDLPGLDGYDVIRRIRNSSKVPIVVVSGRDEEPDIVRGFNYGADQYLSKPFGPLEFVARIQAVLKRSWAFISGGNNEAMEVGVVRIFPESREVFVRLFCSN
jgi:two-component system OmpR family response regulator